MRSCAARGARTTAPRPAMAAFIAAIPAPTRDDEDDVGDGGDEVASAVTSKPTAWRPRQRLILLIATAYAMPATQEGEEGEEEPPRYLRRGVPCRRAGNCMEHRAMSASEP